MEITIGRNQQNDIHVEDPRASRFHCRVRIDDIGRITGDNVVLTTMATNPGELMHDEMNRDGRTRQ